MYQLPGQLKADYCSCLATKGVKNEYFDDYLKWLRFFLDFCEKYRVTGEDQLRIRLFLDKLREKKQGEDQRRRAFHAVSLYFEMVRRSTYALQSKGMPQLSEKQKPQPATTEATFPLVNTVRKSYYSEAGYQEKSGSTEWDEVLSRMASEIKVRHYSRKTLKTYANWSRKFQRFLRNKPPAELGSDDVKAYLTYLAVDCHVASTTQNQAFLVG